MRKLPAVLMTDKREGVLGPNGRWMTPRQVRARALRIMRQFDRLSPEVRKMLNEGTPIPQRLHSPTLTRYIRAHYS